MANPTAARKISHNGNGRPTPATRPLDPYVGHLVTPVWAMRPGAYTALRDLADCMALWMAIYTRNADGMAPCWASKESLAATIGISRASVTRQLERLRKAGLVWELEHGPDPKTGGYRPPSRWALDPFARSKAWRDVLPKRLPEIAEHHGHGTLWLHRARTAFQAQINRSDRIRAEIARDMPVKPRDDRPKRAPRLRVSRGPRGRSTDKYMRRLEKELFRENLPPAQSEPPDGSYTMKVVGGPQKKKRSSETRRRREKRDVEKNGHTKGDGVVLRGTLPDSVGKRADSTGMVAHHRNGSERVCKPALNQGEFEVRSREAAEDTMGTTMDSQTSLDLPSSRLSYVDPGDQV